jgi:hypothetical protein
MKKVIFLPQSEEEMNDSAIFYESQSRGLGQVLGAVTKGTNYISRHPIASPALSNDIRRNLIGRFPYGHPGHWNLFAFWFAIC